MANHNVSKPMRVVALRLTEEERARLQRIADDRRVTLSWVIREGARLYAEDAGRWIDEHRAAREGRDGATAS
jgi:predicted transcriptional regulator